MGGIHQAEVFCCLPAVAVILQRQLIIPVICEAKTEEQAASNSEWVWHLGSCTMKLMTSRLGFGQEVISQSDG